MIEVAGSENTGRPLQLLLAGGSEEELLRLRCMLATNSALPHGNPLRVESVRSLKEALDHSHETRYDVLLCSDQSPDDTAFQLLCQVHKDHPDVPVVFLGRKATSAAVQASIQAATDRSDGTTNPQPKPDRFADSRIARQRDKSEETLRTLWRTVEQSADLVIMLDRSGVMEYVNPAFETITGYSQKEAIGQTLGILKSEQHAGELYEEMWNTVLAGNVFRGIVEERKKNGETCTIEKALTPLRGADGNITHFICTGRDITDHRRLQSELQQVQKMDAIGRLAGGVAHDFNNLLLVISAYAELMLDSLGENHPSRRNVTEIITASRRAANLTRQLLAFGRKQVQMLQVLDLNSVLAEISGMLPRLIGEDIELVIQSGKNLGRIKADPIQIEQIVMNLAANARDAMPRGGRLTIETSTVEIDESYMLRHSTVPPGNYVLLTVTDSGEGIAPHHLAHIFEPFYTTKEVDKGTGLGLATVYGIVKQNGGFIWVYSEPGLGATFKIYLPCVQSTESELHSVKPEESCPGGSETILLVEDETAVRESTLQFLVQCGYTVLPASDGESALRASREHSGPIQLMICDVVMPGMSGPQLAEQLALERPDTKTFFVSGYAEKAVLQRGDIDVLTNFLQKPFSLRVLARKVREVLVARPVRTLAATSSG